ncbi:MAG TPA: hypothetical protein VNT99_08820 [Methylomirabilota bacterium]|nr:hypothetical protein [Methylomirabilota bacterium]
MKSIASILGIFLLSSAVAFEYFGRSFTGASDDTLGAVALKWLLPITIVGFVAGRCSRAPLLISMVIAVIPLSSVTGLALLGALEHKQLPEYMMLIPSVLGGWFALFIVFGHVYRGRELVPPLKSSQ